MAPPKKRRREARRVALAICVALWSSGAFCGPSAPLEQAIKATYLYKLVPFISWPDAAAAASASRPLTICIVGQDPFGPQLDHVLSTQSYNQRSFQVARVDVIGPQSPCDVAYLGGSAAQSVAAALNAVRGAAILTVTDHSSTPGIVDFILQDGRVRLRIDAAAAEENNLNISSKVLSIALSVKPAKGQVKP